MHNYTSQPLDLPPLPSYTLRPQPPLLPGVPDAVLSVVLPIAAYWTFSMFFHFIDVFDLFPQYRLHTPTEVLQRNHATRWEVCRDVIIQQLLQAIMGSLLGWLEPEVFIGKDEYNVAVWAQRIRLVQRFIPQTLAFTGLDAKGLAQKAVAYSPSVAGALAGGLYPASSAILNGQAVPAFTAWELSMAKFIYWVAVPALQFAVGIVMLDTWQYFMHRGMHMSKWWYTQIHSRHHRLYVPYAYGALYNHPLEGFLMDTCGAGLAYLLSGMSPRQGMCLFVGSTIKTVDDHCGYAFPLDPLQHLTSNNAGYHDVHHQSWGIKTNFSQPFFIFWDRVLGTKWVGGDVSLRYERARVAAEKKHAKLGLGDKNMPGPITASGPQESITAKSDSPYQSSNISIPSGISQSVKPSIPSGKATSQAHESRAQVLADPSPAGGVSILAEETTEEAREAQIQSQPQSPIKPQNQHLASLQNQQQRILRRSPRKRSQSSTPAENLLGLKDLVVGSVSGSSVGIGARGVNVHGYTGRGKVLGYESSI